MAAANSVRANDSRIIVYLHETLIKASITIDYARSNQY